MPDNRLVCSYVRSTGAITSKEPYGQTGYEGDRSTPAGGRAAAQARGAAVGSCASAGCYTPIGQRLGEAARCGERSHRPSSGASLWDDRDISMRRDARRYVGCCCKGPLAAGFPTELCTIKRVRALIKREFGVAYSNTGGWAMLRGLGFTPQKPERRALQRDEQAIVQWKRKQCESPRLFRRAPGLSQPPSPADIVFRGFNLLRAHDP